MARQLGYTQEEIDALDHVTAADPAAGDAAPPPGRAGEKGAPATDAGARETIANPFDPALTTALLYTERMTDDAHTVTDALFERMRRHYTDTQILEITCVVGLANYWNRFTTALRIDLSGTNEPYDPPAK